MLDQIEIRNFLSCFPQTILGQFLRCGGTPLKEEVTLGSTVAMKGCTLSRKVECMKVASI